MRLSIKIIVSAAIVAASVAAATFGASAPAAAAEVLQTMGAEAAADMSARKKRRATSLRVTKLSRHATEPPNANRPYYHPVPFFYPFAQQRGYF
jgi:hypothetical protein